MSDKPALRRSLSLTHMVLYGLGTTIGAGIYALISDLAGIAGYYAPASFLIAAMIASLTALSFAELSSRFPQAAGTAIYVKQGFQSAPLSTLTGLLVCFAGMVSAAALLNGFSGYLTEFVAMDSWLAITMMVLLLGGIMIWGIKSSALLAGLITLIEIGGLLTVISVSHDGLMELPSRWHELIPEFHLIHWQGILAGSLLAFYAFIGFEDMVVVAEEVKHAQRTLPIAIILTLFITMLLYLLVMIAAVLAIPPSELMHSDAPLSYLFQHYTGLNPDIINLIALLALINGVLIQMVMASRLLYGLSVQGQLPNFLSDINPRTQTPIKASILVIAMVLVMAIIGHLAILAQLTSLVMLIIFALVNMALWRIKQRETHRPADIICFPLWVPIIAFFVSSGFVVISLLQAVI